MSEPNAKDIAYNVALAASKTAQASGEIHRMDKAKETAAWHEYAKASKAQAAAEAKAAKDAATK